MAEDFPDVSSDSDAWTAVTLLAERRLPGLVVTNTQGTPTSVLPASPVVRILVPSYVQDYPSLDGEKLDDVITASRLLQLALVAG